MKKLYPCVYLLAVYGIIGLLLVFEVDPGPFVPAVLILGAGALNIAGSYRLYQEEEDRTLKFGSAVLFFFLFPVCLIILYFMYAILALTSASAKEAALFVLACFLIIRILLLPASFYLYHCLRIRESSLLMKILAFIPVLWLVPLFAG